MSREKLRVAQTDAEVLVTNLRGEVGEVVVAWTLLRAMIIKADVLRTGDLAADFESQELLVASLLSSKLSDEIVSRLSELAERKVGRLNFYFVARKLDAFYGEAECFDGFIKNERFREKRNQQISHKRAPETWREEKSIRIPYAAVTKAVAMSLRLMKQIDRHVLGPSAPYLWRAMRRRRYTPLYPPRAQYFLLPHLGLSKQERAQIIGFETEEGRAEWTEMKTTIDGREAEVLANRKWAGIVLPDGSQMVLDVYPLERITGITSSRGGDDEAEDEREE